VGLTYDAANRRSTVTLPNGILGTYGFDDANQLLSIDYAKGATPVANVLYAYDAAGRRVGHSGSLAKLLMPPTVTATEYDAANRLTTWGASSLAYDDNGNLTSLGSATFQWNARDQLVATSAGSASFAYDSLGRRSARTVDGTSTSYLHDGLNPVLVNGGFMLDGPGLDEIYAEVSASATTSRVSDALGSTRLLTDGSGAATTAYSYTPYGAAARTGSDDTTFQFTGRENDAATNLNYYRARYYHPELGRFISEDPIGLLGGINTYAYVHGNPLSYTDPTGEYAWIVAGAVIGAVVNVGVAYIANDGELTGQQLAAALVSGAVAGAVGAVAGPLGGSIAMQFGLVSNGVTAAVASGALSGAGSAAGQYLANLIDPCNATNPLNAALWGGIGGGIAKGFFPTRNLNSWSQALAFGPKSLSGLFGSSNAWLNNGSFATSSGVGAAANFPGINPF
jgi:RHS repeat-associated protein